MQALPRSWRAFKFAIKVKDSVNAGLNCTYTLLGSIAMHDMKPCLRPEMQAGMQAAREVRPQNTIQTIDMSDVFKLPAGSSCKNSIRPRTR